MNITPFIPKTSNPLIEVKDWPPAVKKVVTAVSPILTMTALFSLITPLSLSVKVALLSSALITKYASAIIESEPLPNPPLDIPLPPPLVMEALKPSKENQKSTPLVTEKTKPETNPLLGQIHQGFALKKVEKVEESEKPEVEDNSLLGTLKNSMLARRQFVELPKDEVDGSDWDE